jgi:hypothetical protein
MVTPMETVFLPPITDVAYQNCQQRALPFACRGPLRVKLGSTRGDQMTSALLPTTDVGVAVDTLGTSGVPETMLIESSGL